MIKIHLTDDDWAELVELQVRHWRDFPARFSCNAYDVWPTAGFGLSQQGERVSLAGVNDIVDRVAELVRDANPRGGRFFVCPCGVWAYDDSYEQKVQVAEFVGVRAHRFCAIHRGSWRLGF